MLYNLVLLIIYFFFFSSRRRHTRLTCDWSSDVSSSDLEPVGDLDQPQLRLEVEPISRFGLDGRYPVGEHLVEPAPAMRQRSEERRVGKECRSRWWPYH